MTRDLNSEYFEWLCSLVRDSKPIKHRSYRRLMVFLYHTEFEYNIPMDGNRCADGISLRYRFGYEHGIGDPVIASCLDNNPCSVLEMMVALALRCEEHIMLIPENGLMSGRWFWSMITNLGLDEMYDSNYDEISFKDLTPSLFFVNKLFFIFSTVPCLIKSIAVSGGIFFSCLNSTKGRISKDKPHRIKGALQ